MTILGTRAVLAQPSFLTLTRTVFFIAEEGDPVRVRDGFGTGRGEEGEGEGETGKEGGWGRLASCLAGWETDCPPGGGEGGVVGGGDVCGGKGRIPEHLGLDEKSVAAGWICTWLCESRREEEEEKGQEEEGATSYHPLSSVRPSLVLAVLVHGLRRRAEGWGGGSES